MTISPVTGGATSLIDALDVRYINELYHRRHNIDVSRFFGDARQIELRRCDDTEYEFYYPFSVEGDPAFYSELYSRKESEAWAYADSRWEFEWVRKRLTRCDGALLDIGAGDGAFLTSVSGAFSKLHGIETNPTGAKAAQRLGFEVFEEKLEACAANLPGRYNVITAFQVLEHISDVKGFISSAIKLLAPGGILVIAVPDNDGFVGKQPDLPLNLPPHHVGRWTERSLSALSSVFDLRLLSIEREPLAQNTIGWYQSWAENAYLPNSRITRSLYYRLGLNNIFKDFLTQNRNSICGHTILASFERA